MADSASRSVSRGWITGVVASVLFAVIAVWFSLSARTMPDFFIYRAGAELAIRGENPYDLTRIREMVAVQFPEEDPQPNSFVNNCGYFLPPQAVFVFAPFAVLPLGIAKVVWALLHGLAALAIVQLPRLLRNNSLAVVPQAAGLLPRLVPFFLVLNLLMFAVVIVGQTPILAVGCLVCGLWLFGRTGRANFWLGVLLWSLPFVKPHLAIPLVPLAWYLGGWKRAAALVCVVALWNVLCATLVGGSPVFLRDYLMFLSESHRSVIYNRAELNLEMTSWNRLLFVLTAPFAGNRFLVEQTATTAVASYLVWFGLLLARVAIAGAKPSVAWATAAAACGAVLCPQVLGYEAVILLLAVPWIADLFATKRLAWAWIAVLLLGLQTIPYQTFGAIGWHFHRPLCAFLFGLLVLCGPLKIQNEELKIEN